MNNRQGKSLFAIALILMGLLLVLQNFNIPFLENLSLGYFIGVFWPLFILIPGLNMLRRGNNFGGIIATLIGSAFLLENALEIFNINFNTGFLFKFIWPAILITIGYRILKHKNETTKKEDDYIKSYDNSEKKMKVSHNINFNSKTFRYTSENTPLGISKLALNISFGGAEILVEEGIQVILVGQYVMGGHEFFGSDSGGMHSDIKEVRYDETNGQLFDRTLIIKANITFGGLEVTER